ncbi:leucine-rich repeat-containing protein 56 [Conger conger]|uniref:leucine-rich repeat-containing protein 56 n=1 Tax=Conger conger TaxID=82655 RepID=UPI002A5AFF72|nr:leucine-rich repeat-containing protein 56 [Conger conger]
MWRSLDSTMFVRPGTPCVSVTELSGSGQINPTPSAYEDSDHLVELYLSPEKLRALTGVEDLGQVTTLDMCVDTRENTLGNFGSYLPSLAHLKVNNSLITSVRDLGTTLSHLQALWMSRCGLADLDGIPSFTSLKELYVAYNDVWDLSQVSLLEQLQVLDLEGNSVDDLIQVQYLGLCSQLSDLTLEGNPICARPNPGAAQAEGYSYRSAVRELIPQLRYLDNVPAGDTAPRRASTTTEDWALLKESIKDSAPAGREGEEEPASAPAPSRPGSAQRGVTAVPAHLSLSRPCGARPGSAPCVRPGSAPCVRPGSASADSDPALLDQDASGLTHGVGRVICGNPVQVLRAHRQKMGIPAPASEPPSSAPPRHTPEHTFDPEETDGKDRKDVFSELRAWRREHSRRLQAIEQERQPQVMKISHSDEDEGGEEEGMGLSLTSDEEEEGGRAVCGRLINTTSPDSSFNSPPPDPPLSPSPPPGLVAPPGGQGRPAGVRARRLRVRAEREAPLPWGGPESAAPAPEERRREEGVPKIRPALETPRGASLSPSTEEGKSGKQPISRQPVIVRSSASRPPLLTRPLTARAVLQRLPNHRALSPGPGPAQYGGSPSR